MCFKVSAAQQKRLEKALGPQYTVEDYEPQEEVSAFAHPLLPVATILAPYSVSGMTWGLVPTWARTLEEAAKLVNSTLNARCETIYELPSFRDAAEAGQRDEPDVRPPQQGDDIGHLVLPSNQRRRLRR